MSLAADLCSTAGADARVVLAPIQPEDQDWVHGLQASVLAESLPSLPEAQFQMLLDLQIAAQNQQYNLTWPDSEYLIILFQGQRAGRIILSFDSMSVRIVDISVSSSQRGQGIASEVIQRICSRAAQDSRSVGLQVVVENPARELYRRIGFTECGAEDVYVGMIWEPSAAVGDQLNTAS